MELKVWVEGVARVVCGLSLNTSCQDVVIALAQSLGQTGRYILLLKLRGKERQLGADDCPLQHLSQLGQLAAEVRFVLRRTGPSTHGDGEDTPEPHRALSSPGSSARPKRTKPNRAWSPSPRASPVPLLEPLNSPKEEAFRQILLQQRRLQELEVQLLSLERETEAWERESSSDHVPGPALVAEGEPEEPEHRHQWVEELREELREETDRERDLHRRLHQLQSSMDDHGLQTQELRGRAAHLEQDLQLGAHRRSSRAEARQPEEALRPLEQELQHRRQQGEDLEAALSGTQRDLQRKEEKLQGRREVLEELNKELRQCKLQHFILQTGAPAADQINLPGTEGYLSNAGLME